MNFSRNTRHNHGSMAKQLGVYYPLWRPELCGFSQASELLPFLEVAVDLLKHEEVWKQLRACEPENGWGSTEDFETFLHDILNACAQYPDAKLSVSR